MKSEQSQLKVGKHRLESDLGLHASWVQSSGSNGRRLVWKNLDISGADLRIWSCLEQLLSAVSLLGVSLETQFSETAICVQLISTEPVSLELTFWDPALGQQIYRTLTLAMRPVDESSLTNDTLSADGVILRETIIHIDSYYIASTPCTVKAIEKIKEMRANEISSASGLRLESFS